MSTLIERLKELNEEARKWAAETQGRCAGELVEDPEHWAEYGIYTAEQLDLFLAQSTYTDLHKDAYGFRPSYDLMSEMSLQEIEERIADLTRHAERDAEEEAERLAYEKWMEEEEERAEALRASLDQPLPYDEYDR